MAIDQTAPKDGTRILVYATDIDRVLIATFRPSLGYGLGGVRRWYPPTGCLYLLPPGTMPADLSRSLSLGLTSTVADLPRGSTVAYFLLVLLKGPRVIVLKASQRAPRSGALALCLSRSVRLRVQLV
jgi:hypothetical protein